MALTSIAMNAGARIGFGGKGSLVGHEDAMQRKQAAQRNTKVPNRM